MSEKEKPIVPAPPRAVEVATMLIANIVSVVGVVAVNKRVYNAGFTYPTVLMTLHFIVTWLFVVCANRLGVFEAKRIQTWQYGKLGAAQVGSVALVNLSLFYNPVGTYQLLKFCVIFVTCFLEYLMFRKVYPKLIYATLVLLVVSISLATITSIHFSVVGTLVAMAGAICTSYYQICNKFIQNEFHVSPLQLLHYEQPFSAMWCALLALCTDNVGALAQFNWTAEVVGLIVASSVCAFGVNVTCYLIIGKTSPITYSVIGHVKTVSIFLVGYFFFGDQISMSQLGWMLLAFGCIVYYGVLTSPPSPPAGASSLPSINGGACATVGAPCTAGPSSSTGAVICATLDPSETDTVGVGGGEGGNVTGKEVHSSVSVFTVESEMLAKQR